MEEVVKAATLYLATGVEVAAAVIIGLAALQAMTSAMLAFFRRQGTDEERYAIRLHLGRWLALSLEFLVAADILRTAVAPTWDEIGKLGAIIVLRTLLNFFLEKEVQRVEEHHRKQHAEHPV